MQMAVAKEIAINLLIDAELIVFAPALGVEVAAAETVCLAL
jgi:hypothetical protein